MNSLLRYICLSFLAFGLGLSALAYELVTPPAGLPLEKWEMLYDDYRILMCDKNATDYINKYSGFSREITIARDSTEFYMKGIFEKYPDAWIKCLTDANDAAIYSPQTINASYKYSMWFYLGTASFQTSDGNTYYGCYITFQSHKDKLPYLKISDDGNTMTFVDIAGNKEHTAFWYKNTPESGNVEFDEWYRLNQSGQYELTPQSSGFPDTDFPVNILFRKIPSGIGTIGEEIPDDTDMPMYDLHGRIVNPENARPGIYIRNGKKILIK